MSEPTGDMAAAFESALNTASDAAPETSPVSPPVTETPAETVAPAAIVQAASETPAPEAVSAEQPQGEPPKWRWQDILENARKEHDQLGYTRAKQEIETQYADFKDLSPQERAGLTVWNKALRGDPQAIAMVEQVNPALAAAITGKAPQSAPEPEPQPDAAIQLQDGSTVPVFTPEGMKRWQQWNQKHLSSTLEQQLSEKFKPLAQTAETLRAQQQEAARHQEMQSWAAKVLNPIKRLPYFEEFKPEIQKALAAVPETFTGSLEDVVVDTYTKLHAAKLDALTKNGEAKALASIQTRAVANTGNPAAPSASQPKKFKANAEGFAEALAHFSGG